MDEPAVRISSEVLDEVSPTMAISLDIDDGASETSREKNSRQQHVPQSHLPTIDGERSRKPTKGSERDEMENLLHKLNGHLGTIFSVKIPSQLDSSDDFSCVPHSFSGS